MKTRFFFTIISLLFFICNSGYMYAQQNTRPDLRDIFKVDEKIQYYQDFTISGKKYTLVCIKDVVTAYLLQNSKMLAQKPNSISAVYIVPEGFKAKRTFPEPKVLELNGKTYSNKVEKWVRPPKVTKFILHCDGPEADTATSGVVICEVIYKRNGDEDGRKYKEILLPDDIGEKFYHIMEGMTKWEKPSGIEVVEKYSMELEQERFYKH